ncbi:MAG TPA: hypothetical protein DEZ09_01795 [Holosporales bacterium]|nr:hypothetical protein [Holosporales bacterium]
MSDPNIQKLLKETYLKAIENSVGSRLFNSVLVKFKDTGKIADVLGSGTYSCAFFVSSILYLFQSIDRPHTTVASVIKSLDANKCWSRVDPNKIEAGDVIFWEKIKFDDDSENAHVGFAISENEAISTDYRQKNVARHTIIREGAKRNVDSVYRYSWPDMSS